jgi:hypothetical protein
VSVEDETSARPVGGQAANQIDDAGRGDDAFDLHSGNSQQQLFGDVCRLRHVTWRVRRRCVD